MRTCSEGGASPTLSMRRKVRCHERRRAQLSRLTHPRRLKLLSPRPNPCLSAGPALTPIETRSGARNLPALETARQDGLGREILRGVALLPLGRAHAKREVLTVHARAGIHASDTASRRIAAWGLDGALEASEPRKQSRAGLHAFARNLPASLRRARHRAGLGSERAAGNHPAAGPRRDATFLKRHRRGGTTP